MSLSSLPTESPITGKVVEFIRFEKNATQQSARVLPIASPDKWCAVSVNPNTVKGADSTPQESVDLELLTFTPEAIEESKWLDEAREWCERGTSQTNRKSTLISLHGVDVLWGNSRAVIRSPQEKLVTVRKAVIEFAFVERELAGVENSINKGWSDLEDDAPLAYQFKEQAVSRKEAIGERFRTVVAVRARLSKLIPLAVQAAQYPPTLESQTAERLRERMRIEDRLDVAERQIEAFERVYDMCGQRSSDFMLARSGHILEWIIIILLAVQTILTVIDLIPSSGT
jgi:hypothetical protein